MASTRGGEDGEEEGEEEEKSGNLALANHGGLLFQECTQGKYKGFAVSRNTQYGSLLISACGTLSLSILGPRYPQAGPPGRLTSGKVIFPRVARCFYVAEKIKLGNPGGKESELL